MTHTETEHPWSNSDHVVYVVWPNMLQSVGAIMSNDEQRFEDLSAD